jgi:hypothetical protein
MTDTEAVIETQDPAADAVEKLIIFLETGTAPDDLFAPDIFTDLSFPHWRLQSATAADVLAVRSERHPFPGCVRVERLDRTGTGFVIAFEERWRHEAQHWYCREMIRADVVNGRIVDMALYCTGDWDEARQQEHAAAVKLIRP